MVRNSGKFVRVAICGAVNGITKEYSATTEIFTWNTRSFTIIAQ